MRWGNYLGLSKCVNYNPKTSCKREAGESKAKEEDGMTEAEVMMSFEDGREFNKPKNASSL